MWERKKTVTLQTVEKEFVEKQKSFEGLKSNFASEDSFHWIFNRFSQRLTKFLLWNPLLRFSYWQKETVFFTWWRGYGQLNPFYGASNLKAPWIGTASFIFSFEPIGRSFQWHEKKCDTWSFFKLYPSHKVIKFFKNKKTAVTLLIKLSFAQKDRKNTHHLLVLHTLMVWTNQSL